MNKREDAVYYKDPLEKEKRGKIISSEKIKVDRVEKKNKQVGIENKQSTGNAKIAGVRKEIEFETNLASLYDLKNQLKEEIENFKGINSKLKDKKKEYNRDYVDSFFRFFFNTLIYDQENVKKEEINKLADKGTISAKKIAKIEQKIKDTEGSIEQIRETLKTSKEKADDVAKLEAKIETLEKEVDFYKMNLEKGIVSNNTENIIKKTEELKELKNKMPKIEEVGSAESANRANEIKKEIEILNKEISDKKDKIKKLQITRAKKIRDGEGLENIDFEIKVNMEANISLKNKISQLEAELNKEENINDDSMIPEEKELVA